MCIRDRPAPADAAAGGRRVTAADGAPGGGAAAAAALSRAVAVVADCRDDGGANDSIAGANGTGDPTAAAALAVVVAAGAVGPAVANAAVLAVVAASAAGTADTVFTEPDVIVRSGDWVALIGPNGRFLQAEAGGGGPLWANRSTAAGWETFTLILDNDGGAR